VQFFSAWLFGIAVAEPTPGLWRTPATVQGCQAIKFPARTLKKLVAWARLPEWQKFNESDVALGLAQQRMSMRIANHMPDIVQHTGHVSVVSHGMLEEAGITDEFTRNLASASLPGRVSANFPGKHFDAMKLFSRHDLFR
jgi:predicted amidohydrolase YtcJ